MAEQPALVGQPDLRAVGELARLAQVVHERGGHQQVRVEPRVQLAGLERERRDGDRVLEQAAEVGVVAAARARGAAPGRAQLGVAEQLLQQRAVAGLVDLAGEVLEEAVELVDVAVGDREERRRVGLGRALDRPHLDLQLVAEALDAALDAHEVAAVEPAAEQVGVAEHARRQGGRAVAQLQREVGRAGPRGQAVLARAGVDAGDLVAGPERAELGRGHASDDGAYGGRERRSPFATVVTQCSHCAGIAGRTGSARPLWCVPSRAGTTPGSPRRPRSPSSARPSAPSASRSSIPRSSSTSRPRARRCAWSRAIRARSTGRTSRSTRPACRARRATW